MRRHEEHLAGEAALLRAPQRGGGLVQARGGEALAVFAAAVRGCADAALLTGADPTADAVVIWMGLHGLAHQRLVAPAFPWPGGVAERLVTALTGLPPARAI